MSAHRRCDFVPCRVSEPDRGAGAGAALMVKTPPDDANGLPCSYSPDKIPIAQGNVIHVPASPSWAWGKRRSHPQGFSRRHDWRNFLAI